MSTLEKVVIGDVCFTSQEGCIVIGTNNSFFLKDCVRLREVKIGSNSFNDYSVCEIEDLPSLEVMEIGSNPKLSCGFNYASLELKGDSGKME